MDLKKYVGEKVSILVDAKDKIENDVGYLEEWDGKYVTLRCENPNFDVKTIILRKDVIRSIWVYKDKEMKYRKKKEESK